MSGENGVIQFAHDEYGSGVPHSARFGSGGLNTLCPTARPRDNRSHAASEGRYRGSDLAVTAGELNAGAGVGRLPDFGDLRRSKSVVR